MFNNTNSCVQKYPHYVAVKPKDNKIPNLFNDLQHRSYNLNFLNLLVSILTRVVPDKGPLNGGVLVSITIMYVCIKVTYVHMYQ